MSILKWSREHLIPREDESEWELILTHLGVPSSECENPLLNLEQSNHFLVSQSKVLFSLSLSLNAGVVNNPTWICLTSSLKLTEFRILDWPFNSLRLRRLFTLNIFDWWEFVCWLSRGPPGYLNLRQFSVTFYFEVVQYSRIIRGLILFWYTLVI